MKRMSAWRLPTPKTTLVLVSARGQARQCWHAFSNSSQLTMGIPPLSVFFHYNRQAGKRQRGLGLRLGPEEEGHQIAEGHGSGNPPGSGGAAAGKDPQGALRLHGFGHSYG